MLSPILNPALTLAPSQKFIDYVKTLTAENDTPKNIAFLIEGCHKETVYSNCDSKYVLKEEDYEFIDRLSLPAMCTEDIPRPFNYSSNEKSHNFVTVSDLHWLNRKLEEGRKNGEHVYLHQLLENSTVNLPENTVMPRNPVLEKRCETLRAQQANREYRAMTRNIDNIRKQEPEDTIAYQMKQMNRQLIAIGQFIVSVLAGFAFGFIGIELIIGNLDFGFRLLLGIICALVIALAELYFLAKKLNEELNFETKIEEKSKQSKMHLD